MCMCSETNECLLNKKIIGKLIVCIVFNTTVTQWLKEQSPLTEEELQKLCISIDDFKVLNNWLWKKSNYYPMLTVFTYDLLEERCIDDIITYFIFLFILYKASRFLCCCALVQ